MHLEDVLSEIVLPLCSVAAALDDATESPVLSALVSPVLRQRRRVLVTPETLRTLIPLETYKKKEQNEKAKNGRTKAEL